MDDSCVLCGIKFSLHTPCVLLHCNHRDAIQYHAPSGPSQGRKACCCIIAHTHHLRSSLDSFTALYLLSAPANRTKNLTA